MPKGARVIVIGSVAAVGGLLLTLSFAVDGPSVSGCAERWNAPGNADVRRGAESFELAAVQVWDTKAGHHCGIHVFSDVGGPWSSFVLWVDRPQGAPSAYGFDIGGDRYGGDELGGETSWPANGTVTPGGRILVNG